MSRLSAYFDRLLPVIEADLHSVLEPPDEVHPQFYRMMHYHMGWVEDDGRAADSLHTGKRIRPLICLLICEAVCSDSDPARPAAAAVELIHNFSLLHDDVQDRSPLRRNRQTVWRIWGDAQAINAGDSLFTLAHLAIPRLAGDRLPALTIARLLEILDETSLELTRGQFLDIWFETEDRVAVEAYLDMVAGKTAALLSGATRMGALSAGASAGQQTHYADFGHQIGLAFQVQDDILDIWGDPALTGKQAASDIYQRKKSLPVLYGLARSPELGQLYASPEPFDAPAVTKAKTLLEKAGALDYARGLVEDYSGAALAALEAASPSGEAGEALVGLVDVLLRRDR